MRNTLKEKHAIFRLALTAFMLVGVLALGTANPARAAGICYVNGAAPGGGGGTSWADPYGSILGLQTALGNVNCTEIWVAAGPYIPGGTRDSVFQLNNGVAIYGGFTGSETAREQRDPSTNETILSGNVDLNPSTDTGNAYHVVNASNTDSTAVLDGFTITDGYADGTSDDSNGAGILVINASPTLANLIIEGNTATYDGGGLYSGNTSSPTLTDIIFENNSVTDISQGHGGGMSSLNGSPTLSRVTFNGNTATTNGGGLYINQGNIVMTDVTFFGNSAAYGGGMSSNWSTTTLNGGTFMGNTVTNNGGGLNTFNGSLTLTNATFSDNTAKYGGGVYSSGDLSLTNATMTANDADSGGGLAVMAGNPIVQNTIFWGNTAISSANAQIIIFGGSLTLNYDVIQDGCPAFATCSNIQTTDPKLGTLGNYGGHTNTIPLLADSSAIDSANDTYCPATDQRGVPRPQRFHCDIGAYEVEDSTLTFKSAGKQDGWILEKAENSGKGGTKNALGKVLYVGDDALNRQYRVILSFNTTGIPDNAVITKVILRLKKAGVVGKVPFKKYRGLRVDIKKPRFGTKAALQPSDFQAKASKLLVGKFPARLSSGWYVSTLNSTAYSYINLTGLTQFRVRFYKDDNNDFGADYLKLYSGNATLASRPTLIVKYYIP